MLVHSRQIEFVLKAQYKNLKCNRTVAKHVYIVTCCNHYICLSIPKNTKKKLVIKGWLSLTAL